MKLLSSNFINMLFISSLIHGGLGFMLFVPAPKQDTSETIRRVQITSFDSLAFESSAPQFTESEMLDLAPTPQQRMQPVTRMDTVRQPEQTARLMQPTETLTPLKKETPPEQVDESEKQNEKPVEIEELTQSIKSLPVNAPRQSEALTASYENVIVAQLERNKRYPERAIRRGIEGEALLTLRICKSGNVLESQVLDSSGFSILDEEVLRMVSRASPFPAMPDELGKREAAFTIPVAFRLE